MLLAEEHSDFTSKAYDWGKSNKSTAAAKYKKFTTEEIGTFGTYYQSQMAMAWLKPWWSYQCPFIYRENTNEEVCKESFHVFKRQKGKTKAKLCKLLGYKDTRNWLSSTCK